ncbi:MAG: EAL domain-containing protein [Gammaproteobacteria bacterium]
MTLYKQLVLLILTLLTLMFLGTLLVNFYNTRAFLTEQLASHAQDTATTLGVSLSPPMQAQDVPTMNSIIDAVFDRGYYRGISVVSTQGQVLIDRKQDIVIERVPGWFVHWIKLEAPPGTAFVMSGWRQAGVVRVQSHTGYAYKQLWRTLTELIMWFAVTALLGIIAGVVVLRLLLRPLQAVERQAEAVSGGRYETQVTLPKTRELRSVALAMNRMTEKVKTTFKEQAQSAEHLRVLVYRDPLTGLGNRRYFDAQLQTHLKSNTDLKSSVLLLIQLNDLHEMNNRRGYQAGDMLLKQAAAVLEQATAEHEQCVLARMAGADFGLLMPNAGLADAQQLATAICSGLARLHSQGFSDSSNVAQIGVALYTGGQSATEVLSEADLALRAAQAQGPNTWYHYAAVLKLPEIHGGQEWKSYITEVVRARKLVLFIQPVVDAHHPERILQQEVLVRIPGQDNTLLTARMFMPMAEQMDVVVEIDRAVLTEIIARQSKQREGLPLAVNLSLASLRDADFSDWLFGMLAGMPNTAPRIAFEFSELWAVRELDRVHDFVTRLRLLGHGFGLDQFGRGFSAFGYLQSLRPDYVKIDGSYTEQVTENHDNQFFLSTLVGVAHSLDILVIAQSVESQAQWQILKELRMDGVQGYAVAEPRPIS